LKCSTEVCHFHQLHSNRTWNCDQLGKLHLQRAFVRISQLPLSVEVLCPSWFSLFLVT
jgi:hypothetical protein